MEEDTKCNCRSTDCGMIIGPIWLMGWLFTIGFLGLTSLAANWLLGHTLPDWEITPLHQRPAVLYSLGALLLGSQLNTMGFLAELITAYQVRDAETYSVAERTPEHADRTTPAPHE